MLVHVLDAFIVLEVPHFDITLGDCHEDVGEGNGVDLRDFVPMALIDDTEFAFLDVDKVYVHVFGPKEEVVFILAKFHALNVFTQE